MREDRAEPTGFADWRNVQGLIRSWASPRRASSSVLAPQLGRLFWRPLPSAAQKAIGDPDRTEAEGKAFILSGRRELTSKDYLFKYQLI